MLKKIVVSLLILSIVGGMIFYFFGSSILGKSIKTIVETVGSKVTQTPVKLEKAKLSILSGNGQLKGLYVGNPEGFSKENIFALGQIAIDLETNSLRSEEIVINKIYISEPHISYEKTLRTSNLKELLKNIEKSTGSSSDESAEAEESKPDASEEESDEPSKDVLIKEFIIEKPNVFLGIIGFKTTVILPTIELANIRSPEKEIGVTIFREVIAALSENIKTATKNTAGASADTGGDAMDSANEPLKDVNEGIKNLFGN